MMTYEEALEFVSVDVESKTIEPLFIPQNPVQAQILKNAISAVCRRYLFESKN